MVAVITLILCLAVSTHAATHSSFSVMRRDLSSKELDKPATPRPKALFCYAVVRTPPEPTVALLAKQLDAACDGWRFYGAEEDPENHITKAFDHNVEAYNYAHTMRDMVTKGAYKHMIESGVLDKYEWVLKFDSDSFVRPSTLRKTFEALRTGSRHDKFFGVSDEDGDTRLDGFFVAIHADAVLKIQSMGWPASCDVVLTGNSGRGDASPEDCLNGIGSPNVKALKDQQGHRLVGIDQDDPQQHKNDASPEEYGPEECSDIGKVLVKRAKDKIKGPLCECTHGAGRRPECLSEDFITIHHVKDADIYAELAKAYP